MNTSDLDSSIDPVKTSPWRNPTLNDDGTIDCEIQHKQLGWIPFTATPNDPEELGRLIFSEIKASNEDIPSTLISIESLAFRQRGIIESALAAALRAGMPYTLPGGSEDVIQTRPEEDEANLLGLAIEARDRRAAGDTDASMALRAQSNTVYSLTPAQMIALTDAAKAFKQGLLAHSWQLKDAIAAAEAAGDREAIEAVVWEAAT
ncbi:DUF4376 domain-containing protein [Salinicola endophyticus]|uniref:DUF4376 domain-containing protein n=1 Tax=Salinicola endophyticus TaxID=1949083 RepID=A0ABY8FHW8_9GAMM|nr:DUF4376 domain-containing protein [Salinicola endophyticus]WFF40761.1 DUF4376 domain-containing protein [Salinicola endophyticus]